MAKLLIVLVPLIPVAIFLPSTPLRESIYIIAGLLLLLAWIHRQNLANLRVTADLTRSRGFAGKELTYVLTLKNSSKWPVFWCKIRQSFPEGIGAFTIQRLCALRPRASFSYNITFHGQHRGIYQLPSTKITLGDPLGFHEDNLYFQSRDKIVVYPRILPIAGEYRRYLPHGKKRIPFGIFEDSSRLKGCRDYFPGDHPKKIHWPNLARTGRLQVKEWETTLDAELMIALNLAAKDYPLEDWSYLVELAVESATSLLHSLGKELEKVGFCCNGEHPEFPNGFYINPNNLRIIETKTLAYLAGVQPSDGKITVDPLPTNNRLNRGTIIVWVTPQVTSEMFSLAKSWRASGYQLNFLCPNLKNSIWPRSRSAELGIPLNLIQRRRDTDGLEIIAP